MVGQSRWDAELAGYAPIGGVLDLERFTVDKCEICKAGVSLIRALMATNRSEEEIAIGFDKFCVKMKIEDERVCTGLVNEFKVAGRSSGLCNAFFRKFDTHRPPHNANNVEPYTIVTHFSRKFDTHRPPTEIFRIPLRVCVANSCFCSLVHVPAGQKFTFLPSISYF